MVSKNHLAMRRYMIQYDCKGKQYGHSMKGDVSMAGFDKCILFGHAGYDDINGIRMELWRGVSSRMWFEAAPGFRGKGQRVDVVIPKGPEDPDMLLDAALAFYPEAFRKVPGYDRMYQSLAKHARLDFDLGKGIPAEWAAIRELARPVFKDLTIYEADIRPLQGVPQEYL